MFLDQICFDLKPKIKVIITKLQQNFVPKKQIDKHIFLIIKSKFVTFWSDLTYFYKTLYLQKRSQIRRQRGGWKLNEVHSNHDNQFKQKGFLTGRLFMVIA